MESGYTNWICGRNAGWTFTRQSILDDKFPNVHVVHFDLHVHFHVLRHVCALCEWFKTFKENR